MSKYTLIYAKPTGKEDCKNFFLTFSKKDGYCCDFHANQMVYLQGDVWHLLNPRKFRTDFGFTLEQFKQEMSEIKKGVELGKTIMYNFSWFTKNTERDTALRIPKERIVKHDRIK